jgi:uncharacterized protein YdhG (YjbR/CyaY superfamily)
MKKSKKSPSRTRSSAVATKKSLKSVDDYLAKVPEPARGTLNQVRALIRSIVPEGTTEVISYGIPAFKHKKVLVWYAAFSDHCSLFPTASVIEKFQNELKNHRVSKGTIHFPTDKPLASALLKKIVKARLADVE